jgi:hypothetical protein
MIEVRPNTRRASIQDFALLFFFFFFAMVCFLRVDVEVRQGWFKSRV